jgi:hypothetical protein
MAWQDFKLLGFTPDLSVTTPGYLVNTYNCVPTDRGIGPGPRIADSSSTSINTISTGGALVSSLAGTQELIVGTATKLYGFDLGTTLTDRSGGAYNASTTDTWSITAFGNIVLAANRNDFLQQRTIGAAANFAAVGAAPVPKASIVITAGPTSAPFAVVFDYNDGTNNDVDGWKCSALADYTNWTASTATQSAFGRLLDGIPGAITAAIPYRDGIVAWKRTGMYVGAYTGVDGGTNAIWSWRRISSDIGCIGKNACVEANDVIYFMDDSGIWMFDGSYPRQVPGAMQKSWADVVLVRSPTTASRNYYKAIWDKRKHLLWFLGGQYTTNILIMEGLAYNTVSGLWTNVNQTPFANTAATVSVSEMISARYVVSANKNISTLTWGASGSDPPLSFVYFWCIGNGIITPIIKGIRPHWSSGPTSAVSNWITGGVQVFDSERSVQPSPFNFATVVADVAGVFGQPGRIDVMASGAALVPYVWTTDGIDWEITGVSIDIAAAGKS